MLQKNGLAQFESGQVGGGGGREAGRHIRNATLGLLHRRRLRVPWSSSLDCQLVPSFCGLVIYNHILNIIIQIEATQSTGPVVAGFLLLLLLLVIFVLSSSSARFGVR